MDDTIAWDYHSVRAQKARVGARLRGTPIRVLKLSSWLLLLIGILVLLVGVSFGWLLVFCAVIPWMIVKWYDGELHHLASDKGQSVDARMSGDILGQLPAKPSPQDVAVAVGNVSSGQFMGVRFGLTPNVLGHLASSDQNDIGALWEEAEKVRKIAGVSHYTGSVLAVAIVRSYPDYARIIAQIHLDDEDLIEGVRWQQHIRDLMTSFEQPKRTGGIARDWSFGYIPLLSRFGQNISKQIQGGDVLAVDVGSHVEAVAQLTQTFANRGRQNAVFGRTERCWQDDDHPCICPATSRCVIGSSGEPEISPSVHPRFICTYRCCSRAR